MESTEISSNDRARSLAGFDHAHQLKAANGIANGAAAHAKHLGQFTLGRKFVAGLKFFQDQTFDLLGDFFVDTVAPDKFEFGLEGRGHF